MLQSQLVFLITAALFASQANAQGSCVPGKEEWLVACDKLNTFGSWDGPREGVESCTWNPPTGWVIVDHRVDVHSSSNGSRSVSIVAGGSNFISERNVQSAFQSLLDVAGQYTKDGESKKFQGALKQSYERQLSEVQKYQASHNTLHATVRASAHGNEIFDRKRGWEEVTVHARVRCLGHPSIERFKAAVANEIGMPLGYRIAVKNNCSENVRFGIYYLQVSDDWKAEGWWNISANSRTLLRGNDGPLYSKNRVFYFYGTTASGKVFDGEQYVSLGGSGYQFRRHAKERGSDDVFEIPVCE